MGDGIDALGVVHEEVTGRQQEMTGSLSMTGYCSRECIMGCSIAGTLR
jgi:hypothetical protein